MNVQERGLDNLEGRCIDANSLDYEQRFDRVVAVQVVQHIPSAELRRDALQRMASALVPGGRVLVVHYRWGGIIREQKEGTHDDGRYRIAFTTEDLSDLLRSVGFSDVHVHGCVNLPYRAYRRDRWWSPAVVPADVAFSLNRFSRPRGWYLIATGVR